MNLPDRTLELPKPWAMLHAQFVERFGNVRCQYWQEPLVRTRNGLPVPLDFDDPVLRGFARKAARCMRNTCACCGKPGRVRAVSLQSAVRCGACHGKHLLARQVRRLIAESDDNSDDPFDGPWAVRHEHDFPALLRSVVPSFYWRTTVLPSGQELCFLTRDDVVRLKPWLHKLLALLAEPPANRDGSSALSTSSDGDL